MSSYYKLVSEVVKLKIVQLIVMLFSIILLEECFVNQNHADYAPRSINLKNYKGPLKGSPLKKY